MLGPRFVMLVHLAMTLPTVHGWALPSDNKTSPFSSNESAITGGVDGARDRRQLDNCNYFLVCTSNAGGSWCNHDCDFWGIFSCDSYCDHGCDWCKSVSDFS